jgi:membrane associated rhomboid family serine protease
MRHGKASSKQRRTVCHTFAFAAHSLARPPSQLVTCAFVHANWEHLLGNAFSLLVFGQGWESYLNQGRGLGIVFINQQHRTFGSDDEDHGRSQHI